MTNAPTLAARRQVRLAGSPNTPYPDAVVAGGLIFTSGARTRSPGRGFDAVPEIGRAKRQGFPLVDRQEGLVCEASWGAHAHLEEILQAAGSDNSQVLRQHIWQKDKRFFPCYEAVRMHWQPVPSPSSGIGVASVPGTDDQWIGIDAIAIAPGVSTTFDERTVVAAVDHANLPSASHYSQAVRSGPLVFTAGHIPVMTSTAGKPVVKSFEDIPVEGRFLATGRSHPDSRDGPIAAQTWYIYNELFGLIAQVGLKPEDVVLATVYLSDLKDFPVFHRVHAHLFGGKGPALVVAGFDEVGHRGCLIEIELTALDPSGGLDFIRVEWPKIQPFAAPAATKAGPFVFFSGISGFDETGAIVTDGKDLPEPICSMTEHLDALVLGSVAAQASTAVMRLAEAVSAAGGSLHDLVKVTAYLRHSEDRVAVDAAFAAHLPPEALPAFECVAVHSPGPVPEADVQLEAIAFIE